MKRYRYSFKVRVEHKYEKYLFFFSRNVGVTYYYQIIRYDRKTGLSEMVHETTSRFYHSFQIELLKHNSEEL